MPDKNHPISVITVNGMVPLAVHIPIAGQYLGCGRSQVYADLQAGLLDAVKNGRRTLVTTKSLIRRAKSFPKAQFKPKARPESPEVKAEQQRRRRRGRGI